MKNLLPVVTLLAALFAHGAQAECSKEAAPTVPDGTSATEEDMKAGQQAVKTYLASTNAYLECLDAQGVAAGEEEAPEARDARINSYNAAVDEMNVVAESFNASVRAFKSR